MYSVVTSADRKALNTCRLHFRIGHLLRNVEDRRASLFLVIVPFRVRRKIGTNFCADIAGHKSGLVWRLEINTNLAALYAFRVILILN